MLLKKGVTGFVEMGMDLFNTPEVFREKRAEFKKNCYKFVKELNGEVLEWFDPDFMNRYARAHIKIADEELYIYYNVFYDYIAFSSKGLLPELEFIDHPELKTLFDTRYEVLTTAQLNEPLVRGEGNVLLNENELLDCELEFMNHFETKTVGYLIFNYWD